MSNIRPFYTRKQLAAICGISSKATKGMMERLGVPGHLVGRGWIYYLSDIHIYAPEFLASIIEMKQLTSEDECY